MSFWSYPKYRDTHVEWLGQIPEHWGVERAGAVFRQVDESGDSSLPILSVSVHDGVSDSELAEGELDRKVSRSEDRTKYRRVQKGDLVYNMMRAWQGAFGAVSVAGMVSPAYVVARPTGRVSSEFVERALRTPQAVEEMRRHSRGVTDFRLRLYWEEFKSIRLPIPPVDEERAILGFVRRVSAKIDALVTEQQKLIHLLNEKRQAVIARATAVRSGECTVRLGHLIDLLPGYAFPSHGFADEEGIRLLRGTNVGVGECRWEDVAYWAGSVDDRLGSFLLKPGDLVFGMDRPWISSGTRVAVVQERDIPSLLVQRVARIRARSGNSLRFIRLVLMSNQFRSHLEVDLTGVSVPHISEAQISNFPVRSIDLLQQDLAADEAERELEHIESLAREADLAVSLLEERRGALISAAVTGKIDVRELGAAA